MIKFYALEISAENQTPEIYCDFAEEAREGVSIEGGRDFCSFYSESYEKARKAFENFDNIESYYNNSIMEFLKDELKKKNGRAFSTKEAAKIKKLFESVYRFHEIAAEVLTITEGENYIRKDIRGNRQGDYAVLILPERLKDSAEFYEAVFFGTGTEYSIKEAEEGEEVTPENFYDDGDTYGVYLTEWKTEDIKKAIADIAGGAPENVVLFSITGQHTIIKYDYQTL